MFNRMVNSVKRADPETWTAIGFLFGSVPRRNLPSSCCWATRRSSRRPAVLIPLPIPSRPVNTLCGFDVAWFKFPHRQFHVTLLVRQCSPAQQDLERKLRGMGLGRRSWLFTGSERGGQRATAIYTQIGTVELDGIDQKARIADLIVRISDMLVSRLYELLRWGGDAVALKSRQPDHVPRRMLRFVHGMFSLF